MTAKTPPAVADAMIQRYLEGVPIKLIAREFGVALDTVEKCRRRLGVPIRPKHSVDDRLLTELHAQRLSDYEIGRRLGHNGSVIRRARMRLGLPANYRYNGVPTAVMLAACLFSSAASSHDWYTELKRPDTGGSCCSGVDCHKVDPCKVNDRELGAMLDGVCERLPRDKVLPLSSPDGELHVCYITNWTVSGTPKHSILCVVEGGGA